MSHSEYDIASASLQPRLLSARTFGTQDVAPLGGLSEANFDTTMLPIRFLASHLSATSKPPHSIPKTTRTTTRTIISLIFAGTY
jgi:hypothetical protein